MPYPSTFLVHSATLTHNNGYQQDLAFSTPIGIATAGQTVTGATSHTTAVIVTVASPLVVKTVSGTFTAGEVISTATWSGTFGSIAEHFNSNGELVPDVSSTTMKCRFSPQGTVIKGNPPMVSTVDRVVLPNTAIVAMEDTITITTKASTATYNVCKKPVPTAEAAIDAISHWTCELAKAGA